MGLPEVYGMGSTGGVGVRVGVGDQKRKGEKD